MGYYYITKELEDCILHIIFNINDLDAICCNPQLLIESRKYNIGKGYDLRLDKDASRQFPDKNKDHFHVFFKGREVLAINRDGSAHDGSHGSRIPNSVYDYISANYPDFILPRDRIIESLRFVDSSAYREIMQLI